MNRFGGPEDPCYVAVKNQILHMYTKRRVDLQPTGGRKSTLLQTWTVLFANGHSIAATGGRKLLIGTIFVGVILTIRRD